MKFHDFRLLAICYVSQFIIVRKLPVHYLIYMCISIFKNIRTHCIRNNTSFITLITHSPQMFYVCKCSSCLPFIPKVVYVWVYIDFSHFSSRNYRAGCIVRGILPAYKHLGFPYIVLCARFCS